MYCGDPVFSRDVLAIGWPLLAQSGRSKKQSSLRDDRNGREIITAKNLPQLAGKLIRRNCGSGATDEVK
jgi:hypothetical protein